MESLSFQASIPLLGVSVLTLCISLCFCCYMWRLRREAREDVGYTQITYHKQKPNADMCPVCLDDFTKGDKVAVCPCRHSFHAKCLGQWLINNNTCPMCKTSVRRPPSEGTSLMQASSV